jgi:sterol 3beta-glucosyltransferase
VTITMAAFGSRGDVQPIVALGKALRSRGHDVRMVAGANFRPWIECHGLAATPTTLDAQAVMNTERGHDWVERGNSPVRAMLAIRKLLATHGRAIVEDLWRGSQGTAAIASTFAIDVCAASIAEKLRIPHISVPLQPALFPTRAGPATMDAPAPNRDSAINYLFGKWLTGPFLWSLGRAINNRFRIETLGLGAQRYADYRAALGRALVVQAFSTHVVPHPGDWPPNVHTTGYWFLDDDPDWQPSAALREFLDAGDPPVYVGFGSMTGRQPERLTRVVVDAIARCGCRAVLQQGWAGIGAIPLPPTIHLVESTPHGRLFPLMAAAVHHGGAGTTAQSLRAGISTVVVPHLGDQPFWGRRVAQLGVGPRPIRRNRLTATRLATAIHEALTNKAMRTRASELGAKIRAEDGTGTAVALIEDYLAVDNG